MARVRFLACPPPLRRSVPALLVALLLGCAGLSPHAVAAEASDAAAADPAAGAVAADAPIDIQLPAAISLDHFTDLVGDLLNISVHYAPQRMKSQIRLSLRGKHTAKEVWSIFNQVLEANGMTTVIAGDPPVYQVVQSQEAQSLAMLQPWPQIQALAFPPGTVATLFQLQHLSAEHASQIFTPLVGGRNGQIKALGKDGDRLLVLAQYGSVTDIANLLATLDRAAVRAGFRQYDPELAKPQKLQAALTAAWNAAGRVNGQQRQLDIQLTPDGERLLIIASEEDLDQVVALAQELDLSEPIVGKSYQTGDFSLEDVAQLIEQILGDSSEHIRIIRNQLSGTLLVEATAGQHERIDELLQELAEAPSAAHRQMRSFPIRHRQVQVIADLVRELLASAGEGGLQRANTTVDATTDTTVRGQEQPEDQAAQAAPAADNDTPTTDGTDRPAATPRRGATTGTGADAIALTIDTATNTLTAIGTPRRLAEVADLIAELDVRLPQVELEVVLVSLSDSQSQQLGINLATFFTNGTTSTNLSSFFGLESDFDNTTGAGEGDGDQLVDGVPEFLSFGGLSGLVIDPGDFAALVTALERLGDGATVVRTRVLVDNNSEATVNGVVEQPFASINDRDTGTSTTTFAGTSDAGTQIQLTPNITAGDQLTITYQISQSEFRGASDGIGLPPPKRSDDLASLATIPDGHTIALGGLNRQSESESESRVPVLGSIPFLGWLFRRRVTQIDESRFYVFIRASVLRHPSFEDLKYRSSRIREDAGLPDDWPHLQPRFIDDVD